MNTPSDTRRDVFRYIEDAETIDRHQPYTQGHPKHLKLGFGIPPRWMGVQQDSWHVTTSIATFTDIVGRKWKTTNVSRLRLRDCTNLKGWLCFEEGNQMFLYSERAEHEGKKPIFRDEINGVTWILDESE